MGRSSPWRPHREPEVSNWADSRPTIKSKISHQNRWWLLINYVCKLKNGCHSLPELVIVNRGASGNPDAHRKLRTFRRRVLGLELQRVWWQKKTRAARLICRSWSKSPARWSWLERKATGTYSLLSTTRTSRFFRASRKEEKTRRSGLRPICSRHHRTRRSSLVLRRRRLRLRKKVTRLARWRRSRTIRQSKSAMPLMLAGGGGSGSVFCGRRCGESSGGHWDVEILRGQGHFGHLLRQLRLCCGCSTGGFGFGDGGVGDRGQRRG